MGNLMIGMTIISESTDFNKPTMTCLPFQRSDSHTSVSAISATGRVTLYAMPVIKDVLLYIEYRVFEG